MGERCWWDLGGGAGHVKKMAIQGDHPKNEGKRGGHEKYCSKTLKWQSVIMLKKLAIEQTW